MGERIFKFIKETKNSVVALRTTDHLNKNYLSGNNVLLKVTGSVINLLAVLKIKNKSY